MEMNLIGVSLTLGVVALLLVMAALLSLAETAFIASNKARLLPLEQAGDRRAKRISQMLDNINRVNAALLLGYNALHILGTVLISTVFVYFFDEAGIFYATALMTVLIVVFVEIMPKNYALINPERSALFFWWLIWGTDYLLGSVASLIERLSRWMLRLFGLTSAETESLVDPHDEIRGAVQLLHMEGGVEKIDKDMLGGLLDLNELAVSDIMVHRTKMNALDIDMPVEQLVNQALESPHTRLPLWKDDPENIIGVLHIKSLLRALHEAGNDPSKIVLAQIMTPPWFVPSTTGLGEQLRLFLKRKTHFALVVDEYGEVLGLVTLEDIIEEIVGEIADETDQDIQGVRVLPGNVVIANGSVAIRDINRALDWDLPDEEATTLAGLVIHEARMIPELGQTFTFYGYKFEVIRRERNRITRLRIVPTPSARKPEKLAS